MITTTGEVPNLRPTTEAAAAGLMPFPGQHEALPPPGVAAPDENWAHRQAL